MASIDVGTRMLVGVGVGVGVGMCGDTRTDVRVVIGSGVGVQAETAMADATPNSTIMRLVLARSCQPARPDVRSAPLRENNGTLLDSVRRVAPG
ncbi:MAG: hypothetical protein ACLQHS_11725 [Candidatus Limnocylindrales bacterium]